MSEFACLLGDSALSAFRKRKLLRRIERAAGIALGESSRSSNWIGFDEYAVNLLGSHPLMTHPEIQEYYLEDGKWMSYLAERIPEYAQLERSVEQ